ncbi:Rap1a/Tai family immunity protein [Humitalea sp. 24SJ18S-53]|uniref:Rap1a/Tai family immunity protein n=1 Tax=Humitalea sp. 24SJ18S-53 TaxID=3422307 RepID=UPI003D663F98
MRTMIPAAALAACLALPAFGQGAAPATPPGSDRVTDVTTVSELADMCAPRTTGVHRLEAIAYCQGYLTASGQIYTSLTPTTGTRRPLVCLTSPGPTVAEAGIAFANWAAQNPQFASERAVDGLLRFAQATYPCPVAARGVR